MEPKLLDRMRALIRTKHYSIRTEEAYVQWTRRFILFHAHVTAEIRFRGDRLSSGASPLSVGRPCAAIAHRLI
jgi:hypothetical protein